MSETDEKLIARLAEHVVQIYTNHRRILFPGYYPSGKHAQFWPKIAQVLLERGWDPEEYIATQFEIRGGGFPYPNQLYSAYAQREYEKRIGGLEKNAELKVKLEWDRFNTALDVHGDIGKAMADNTFELSDTFKYVMCKRMNQPCPAAIAETAELKLRTSPALREAYRRIYKQL